VLLPVFWVGYDLFIRRRFRWRELSVRYAIFALVMGWFTYFKMTTMHDTDPTRPYYVDLSVLTFGRGYGWYFNSLYDTSLRWGAWFMISAVLAIVFAIRKNGAGLFFLLFTYVGLLPYVFLVNHRYEWYSYMAFVGIAGMLAIGLNAFRQVVAKILPQPAAAVALSVVFALAAAAHFTHEERRGRGAREYLKGVNDEYRTFLSELRALPDASSVTTLHYTAIPRRLDEMLVLCATQFGLDRMDVETKVVESCPAEGACAAFENGHLRRIR